MHLFIYQSKLQNDHEGLISFSLKFSNNSIFFENVSVSCNTIRVEKIELKISALELKLKLILANLVIWVLTDLRDIWTFLQVKLKILITTIKVRPKGNAKLLIKH